MTVYPSYYPAFRCIASACRHNCCIGWEIDVDEDAYARYCSVKGEFGNRLKSKIRVQDGVASFCLDESDRCPFLNGDNFCDIIVTLGEDALCEICSLHPRFRNFYSNREEIGLGLSCEAAARLILSDTGEFSLTNAYGGAPEDSGDHAERAFFALRARIFEMLQDGAVPVEERIARIYSALGIVQDRRTPDQSRRELLVLERLDPAWQDVLESLVDEDWQQAPRDLDKWLERLSLAFVYRHFARILEGDSLSGVLDFCFHSVRVISALWSAHLRQNGSIDLEHAAELMRMYSSEIEYSDENVDILLKHLGG